LTLAKPKKFMPGNKMVIVGFRKEKRVDCGSAIKKLIKVKARRGCRA